MSNIIVMASWRNIVGCFLKKRLTKGGHGHPRTPPPLATPLCQKDVDILLIFKSLELGKETVQVLAIIV